MPSIKTPVGSFDFHAFNMSGDWNECAGVYMFVKQEMQGQKILYVGLCESFKGRMPIHERWNEALLLGANSVHAVAVPIQATREALAPQLLFGKLRISQETRRPAPFALLNTGWSESRNRSGTGFAL